MATKAEGTRVESLGKYKETTKDITWDGKPRTLGDRVFVCFCCCEKWWVSTTIRDEMFSELKKMAINHGGKHGYLRKCLVGLECHQPKYMWFVRVCEAFGRCSFSNMIFKFLQVLLMALFRDAWCSTVNVFSGSVFSGVCPTTEILTASWGCNDDHPSHVTKYIWDLLGLDSSWLQNVYGLIASSCGNSEKAWNEKRRPVYKTSQHCSSGPTQNPRRSTTTFQRNLQVKRNKTKLVGGFNPSERY